MLSLGQRSPRKSLMQHAACCLASEVMRDVFSDGLTYARAHMRKLLRPTAGQGIKKRSPRERKLMR